MSNPTIADDLGELRQLACRIFAAVSDGAQPPDSAEWSDEGIWMGDAACCQNDPEMFFPHVGGTGRHAKKICAACPVLRECRIYALHHDVSGVWGGLSENERKEIKRGRKPKEIQPCGTVAAFQRHVRDGEKPCDACRAAKNDASRQWSQRRAERKAS
jgi:WhiB family redox-sensing transcriptional regulator